MNRWFLFSVAIGGFLGFALGYVVVQAYLGNSGLLIGWLLCSTVSGVWFLLAARGAIGREADSAPEGGGGDGIEASQIDA